MLEKLRDREQAQRILNPNDERLFTGTLAEQRQARLERRRLLHIAKIVQSDRVEIPRRELEFHRRGIVEHVASPDGDWYRVIGGDPQYLPNATHYYVTADEDVVMLEREQGSVTSRSEYEEHRAAREARRNAPKPRPAWMR